MLCTNSVCCSVHSPHSCFAAVMFGDNYYQVIASSLDWNSAKVAAAQLVYNGMQGHLVTVTSHAENLFIASLRGPGIAVWIDGSDAATEGTWTFTTGPKLGATMTYTNWDIGSAQPNGGSFENCLLLLDDGTWGAAACTKRFYFVVEYEATCALPWCSGMLLADAC